MPHGTSSQGLGDTAGAEVKTGVQKRALKPTQILKEFKTTGQLLWYTCWNFWQLLQIVMLTSSGKVHNQYWSPETVITMRDRWKTNLHLRLINESKMQVTGRFQAISKIKPVWLWECLDK